jgi:hypothetical protein
MNIKEGVLERGKESVERRRWRGQERVEGRVDSIKA